MSKRSSPKPTKPDGPQTYRRPGADIYTLLLTVALIALILATVALWATMKDYNYLIKGGPKPVWNRPATHAPFDSPRASCVFAPFV